MNVATLQRNYPHPEHGKCDVVTVDGKYGFVINKRGQVVEFLRYSEKWNNEEIYLISYNRAIVSVVLALYERLLTEQMLAEVPADLVDNGVYLKWFVDKLNLPDGYAKTRVLEIARRLQDDLK